MAVQTFRATHAVVDNFLPPQLAAAMRQDIENHFGDTGNHRAETHQVWNYWHVPGLYTYLRTLPNKIIQKPHLEKFHQALTVWAIRTLGMADIAKPWLSLYVPGCRQNLHNDSRNGRFAYVYSLTRDERKTIGGETLVYRETDQFRSRLTKSGTSPDFYESVPPRFNRLVVFDDRMPHAVERLDGSMDPLEGRFVMHGHIAETGPIVNGPLPIDALVPPLTDALGANIPPQQHGPAAIRLVINPAGAVDTAELLMDRVKHADPANKDWQPWVESFLDRLRTAKFPPANAPTEVIQALVFGPIAHKK